MISAAAKELSACGCTTRKAACRLYVKGTQARSPNTSMKPKPSWTMSMVVRTASCQWEVHVRSVWEHKELSVHRLGVPPHLIPQSVGHIQQLEAVDQDHGQRWGTSELHLLHQHAQVNDHLRATAGQQPECLKAVWERVWGRTLYCFSQWTADYSMSKCCATSWSCQLYFKRLSRTASTGCVIVKAESFPYSTGSKSLPHTVFHQPAEAFSLLADANGFKTFRCAKVCTGFRWWHWKSFSKEL